MTQAECRTFRLHQRADAPAAGLASFRMTTEVVDGHDSVFYVKGCKLDRFRANPVILLDHRNEVRSIAANVDMIQVVEENGVGSIDLGLRFAETENPNDAGSFAARLYRAGFLRAMSHKFEPIKVRFSEQFTPEEKARWPDLSRYGYIIDEWELMEASFVAIGSNPLALKRALEAGDLTEEDLARLAPAAPPAPVRPRRAATSREASVQIDGAVIVSRIDDLRAAMEDSIDALHAEQQANHRVLMEAVARGATPSGPSSVQQIATEKKLRELAEIGDRIHAACKGIAAS